MSKRAPKTYRYAAQAVMCMHCAGPTEEHPDGRPRLYCSTRCRVGAHRAKAKAAVCTATLGGQVCDLPAGEHERDQETGQPIHSRAADGGSRVCWLG